MSLKANILASYLSQAYVTAINILVLPLYIQYMGAETYGLVGFFSLLQVWFSLLDMGMTPMLARETARFHGGSMDALNYRKLVRALEIVFVCSAIVGGIALFASANILAQHWLRTTQLSHAEVAQAIQLMAVIIAIRWASGLYRSTISGAEKLVWLSGFNSIIATTRFLGVLPILLFIDASAKTFFLFQLGIALLEGIILWGYAYSCFPKLPNTVKVTWSLVPLKKVYHFSLGIAFASLVWILITQVDKLILSHILPLEEYGYFTLAILIANSVTLLSNPISTAIMPRMAKLEAEGKHATVIQLYRQTTQWVCILVATTAVTLSLCAESLLQLWTHNAQLAQQAAPILVLYSIGNAILALCAFPYYLQYAKGNLRLHLIGNVIFTILLVPITILATQYYHTVGAGYAWLSINLVTFLLWIPYIHHRLAPNLNKVWYGNDIILIVLAAISAGYITHELIPVVHNEWLQFMEVLFIGLSTLFAAIIASSDLRARLLIGYKNYNATSSHFRLYRHL